MAEYTREQSEQIVSAALDIGETMLESGAEIHRVEDTVERVCRAYGAVRVEVFSIISLIVVTVQMPDGHHTTESRRVYSSGNNLSRIEETNALSRRICARQIPPEELTSLTSVQPPRHRRDIPLHLLGVMLAAGAFAVFFGGTLRDAVAAAVIGILADLLGRGDARGFNVMAKTFISAVLAGSLALLTVRLGLGDNADKIMIGTIMLLIPGLAFGTALRDMLCGDLMAGSLRLIQSLLVAGVIAGGYGLALVLLGGVLG